MRELKRKFFGGVMGILLSAIFFVSAGMESLAYNNEVDTGVVVVINALYGTYVYQDGEKYVAFEDGDFSSRGSGFFVGKKGEDPQFIVTNQHVVENFINYGRGSKDPIRIDKTYGGRKLPVYFIPEINEMRIYYSQGEYEISYLVAEGDTTTDRDMAVLKINKPTNLRHSLDILPVTEDMVTQEVYTVGFPGISDNELTAASKFSASDLTRNKGIISRIAATKFGVEVVQMDADIYGGNSGGPLVTEKGDVVGINTWGISFSDGSGITNYAVSSNELINFLITNNIPFNQSNGKSGPSLILIIGAVVAIVAVGGILAVFLKSGNKSNKNQGAAASKKGGNSIVRSLSPQHNGAVFAVSTNPITVGRDAGSCVIAYKDGTAGVSGKHCTIAYDPSSGDFIITDLRSTYGTFLMSGQRLDANTPYRIKAGDSFYVGDRGNVLRAEMM